VTWGRRYSHIVRTGSPGWPADGRLTGLAPVLLLASVAARLAWSYLVPNGANFVDLHVYLGGAAALNEPGTLYSYVYADQTPDFPLPFTYPPFAALVFYPLSGLSFGLVALCWQLGTIAALYGVVRSSQRLLGVADGSSRTAMLWTAIAIWTEPLRSTFDYGQVNVFLVLAVLWAAYSTRWWLSGLLVGLAAGVKLTPAITGLYFLGIRRWGAALFAALVFAGAAVLSIVVIGEQAHYYFTDLLGDAGRVGPIGTSFNQSWRGGLSRILGHDVGYGPLVLAAIAATAVLAQANTSQQSVLKLLGG
jgi:alpha-1,2-mannosyltransferase